ncbi:hypothetical protein P1X14_20010 [Sphingomonas sp. AOB5]|uniref:hypothetical protein n=1 Tax=Sphingomonas sp. AOB5 TaxID=3034017 RepID=UPI0023F796C7|nr:hypothetical protein [Sphingomonas sp. AOB5]MDF7777551.1 hypothetical protein [Sphingomonas sp. AOB5]
MRWIAGLALLLGLAAPAMAQSAAGVASFRVGGTALQLKIPEGFCPLDEDGMAAFRRGMNQQSNILNLILITCGDTGFQRDYYVLMTPRTLANETIPRAAFLEELKPIFNAPGAEQWFGEVFSNALKASSERNGVSLEIAGAVTPRGVDDVCGYAGGAVTIQGPNGERKAVQGGCLTTAGGRVVSIYSNGQGTTNADVAKHMRRSRDMALSIMVAPKP